MNRNLTTTIFLSDFFYCAALKLIITIPRNTPTAETSLLKPNASPRTRDPIKAAMTTLVSRKAETFAIAVKVRAQIAIP